MSHNLITPPPSTPINSGGYVATPWWTWCNNVYQLFKGSYSSRSGEMDQGVTYIPDSASLTVYTLPSFNPNDVFIIVGYGSGGWRIDLSGQTILTAGSTATGSLASTNRYNCVTLRGIVKNTTLVVETHEGTLTYA